MADTKSTTKDASDWNDFLFNTKTYETKISDGQDSVTARGNTTQESQQRASEKWDDRHGKK